MVDTADIQVEEGAAGRLDQQGIDEALRRMAPQAPAAGAPGNEIPAEAQIDARSLEAAAGAALDDEALPDDFEDLGGPDAAGDDTAQMLQETDDALDSGTGEDSEDTFAELDEEELEQALSLSEQDLEAAPPPSPPPGDAAAEQIAAPRPAGEIEPSALVTDSPPAAAPRAAAHDEVPVAAAADGRNSRKTRRSGRGRKALRLTLALLAAAALAATAVYHFGADRWRQWLPTVPVAAPALPREAAAPAAPPAPPPASIPAAAADEHAARLQEVAQLRSDLLAKMKEIEALREFYRDGIAELEEELQQVVLSRGIRGLDEARSDPEAELALRAIQRRWAYIDALEVPYLWLHQGSEELLYLSRRAEMDLLVSQIAEGLNLRAHLRHLSAGLQKYQPTADRLAIDVAGGRLRSYEDIWKSLETSNQSAVAAQAAAGGDGPIVEAICDGDTGRIADLGTLTIRAAKCLAQVGATELFLNQVRAISPVAAKHLSAWEGQWLCLNGLKELSPEVARHLFSWEGQWLSLNGLTAFPSDLGELLLSWKGTQLELMGLVLRPQEPRSISLEHLARWEQGGGKLFVPAPVRAAIDAVGLK